MIDLPAATEEEMDKALTLLGDLLSILGWSVRPPDFQEQDGLIIGTPEFLSAWDERVMKRKEDLQ